jgi:gluconate kinase
MSKSTRTAATSTEILLITGPAGVGKSTLCWEISAHLAQAAVEHAVIETDELDRVYPKPGRDALEKVQPGTIDVSALTLSAMWSVYETLGYRRLIMSGVIMHFDFDRRWIQQAIPNAHIHVVRLMASEDVLLERLNHREIGPGKEEQIHRSVRQLQRMTAEDRDDVWKLQTDGKSPVELSQLVVEHIGWTAPQAVEN